MLWLKEYTFEMSISIRKAFPKNYAKTATLKCNQSNLNRLHIILILKV